MRRLGILVVIVMLAALVTVSTASAHQQRTIANKYDVEVGWDKEPAIVNQLNAASIRITKTGTSDPVEGVDQTLKVEIAFGGNTPQEFPLHSVEDQKGYYLADVIPTKAGDYVFTFNGKIEDTPVINEIFESGPNSFDPVQTGDALQVPVVSSAATTPDVSAADVQSARTLAIAGVVIGVLGCLIGIAAVVMKRKS